MTFRGADGSVPQLHKNVRCLYREKLLSVFCLFPCRPCSLLRAEVWRAPRVEGEVRGGDVEVRVEQEDEALVLHDREGPVHATSPLNEGGKMAADTVWTPEI